MFECPFADGCLGGIYGGQLSCADGYSGPLCGVCAKGWYPQSDGSKCSPCEGNSSMSAVQIVSIVIACSIICGFGGWVLSKLMQKV